MCFLYLRRKNFTNFKMDIDPLHIVGMQPIWRTKQTKFSLLGIEIYSHLKKKSYCSVPQIGCIPPDVQGVYRRDCNAKKRTKKRHATVYRRGCVTLALPRPRAFAWRSLDCKGLFCCLRLLDCVSDKRAQDLTSQSKWRIAVGTDKKE